MGAVSRDAPEVGGRRRVHVHSLHRYGAPVTLLPSRTRRERAESRAEWPDLPTAPKVSSASCCRPRGLRLLTNRRHLHASLCCLGKFSFHLPSPCA